MTHNPSYNASSVIRLDETGGRTIREFAQLSWGEQERVLRDYHTEGKSPEWIAEFDRVLRGEPYQPITADSRRRKK